MSVKAIRAAKAVKATPIDRLVLFMLAEHHNDRTGQCDPSVSLLAKETGLCTRTVIRSIERLEAKKILAVRRDSGVKNCYVLFPEPVTLSVTSDSESPVTPVQEPVTLVQSTYIIEPEEPEDANAVRRPKCKNGKRTVAADSRHHQITSGLSVAYESETGTKLPAFPQSLPRQLTEFLKTWEGTAEDFLTLYRDAVYWSSNPKAFHCKHASRDASYLCRAWMKVDGEIADLAAAQRKPSSPFSRTI